MGKAWRIEFDGAFYLVMSPANKGRNISFGLDDSQHGMILGSKRFVDKIRRTYFTAGTASRDSTTKKHVQRIQSSLFFG